MSFVDPIIHDRARALNESEVRANPIEEFRAWFDEAVAARVPQPDAMCLATSTLEGRPSARLVLLRGFDERGFVFFTNYESRKAQDLAVNPFAALAIYWEPLDRQVRIEGKVERASSDEADAYFNGRPRGSQLGAWASPQSRVLTGRQELEQRVLRAAELYRDAPVPRPSYWGGYRVVPELIEFWQGRPNRLHDRLCYRRNSDGAWRMERLAP
jgi:pyridoxamine 5'-phosphate oxidase